MNLLMSLWQDESGVVVSAETVLVGTVGVMGAVTALNVAAKAVDGELRDLGFALRSLDQSFSIPGRCGCGSYTAGSCFQQAPVEAALADLGATEAEIQAMRGGDACRQLRENDCRNRPAAGTPTTIQPASPKDFPVQPVNPGPRNDLPAGEVLQ